MANKKLSETVLGRFLGLQGNTSVPKTSTSSSGSSFKSAFAAARKAQGAGGTFTWKGNKYNTNYAEEAKAKKPIKPKPRPKSFSEGPGKITVTPLPPNTDEIHYALFGEKGKPKLTLRQKLAAKKIEDALKPDASGNSKRRVGLKSGGMPTKKNFGNTDYRHGGMVTKRGPAFKRTGSK